MTRAKRERGAFSQDVSQRRDVKPPVRGARVQSLPQAVAGGGALVSDSRARVLGTARSLFAEFGFEATSIRQIAKELDIVSASLYHHFPTKEEMLHEILREPLRWLAESSEEIALRPVDAEARLVALIKLRIGAWIENWETQAIFVDEGQFFRQRDDFNYVEQAKQRGYEVMKTVLQDGIRARLFRPDLDIYYTINTISSILNAAARSMRPGATYTVPRPKPHAMNEVKAMHAEFVLRVVRTADRIDEPMPCSD